MFGQCSEATADQCRPAAVQNWNPADGQPPLPGGWCDAWQELFPGDPGLTYDPKRWAACAASLELCGDAATYLKYEPGNLPGAPHAAPSAPGEQELQHKASPLCLPSLCSNPMLKPGNRIRRRLDRAFCRLRRWRLQGAELVGREPLPGLSFEGRPVLPSDHFGLLLQLRPA